MAFEVPSHLPRRTQAQEPSTLVLQSIADEPWGTFTTAKASGWLRELDNAIADTEKQIRDIIERDGDEFERQLNAARRVREGVDEIEQQVSLLTDSIHDPQVGIAKRLLDAVQTHSSLAQEALNVSYTHEAASFLNACQEDYESIATLISKGEVLEAVAQCDMLRKTTADAPPPLEDTTTFIALQKKVRVSHDRIQEELVLAYRNGISISDSSDGSTLSIHDQILFQSASSTQPLSAFLAALPASTLDEELNSLRKCLSKFFFEPLTRQPHQHQLGPPFSEGRTQIVALKKSSSSAGPKVALQSLQILFTFLEENLFSKLPSSTDDTSSSFESSLYKPLVTAVISQLLTPSMPSSLDEMPAYLELVEDAVDLEASLAEMGVKGRGKSEVRQWSLGVEERFERRKMEGLLMKAREICRKTDQRGNKTVEIEGTDSEGQEEESAQDDGSWGEEEGWGFDDDEGKDESRETAASSSTPRKAEETPSPENRSDEDDGWEWNDDEPAPQSVPEPPKVVAKPKAATRLEKFSAKAKGNKPGSPMSESVVSLSSVESSVPSTPARTPGSPPPPPAAQKKRRRVKAEKEKYSVTGRAARILDLVQEALREGDEFIAGEAFMGSERRSDRGKFIFQAAYSICDLVRALHPVVRSGDKGTCADVQWSCDFRYLGDGLKKIVEQRKTAEGTPDTVFRSERWDETIRGLELARRRCLEDALTTEIVRVKEALADPHEFRDIGDDHRMKQVEGRVQEVLRIIRSMAQQWKGVLPLGEYMSSVGAVVDEAIVSLVDGVIALDDITATESERLADICRMLEPLQHLFLGASGEGLVGRYVPSWFRYSYLGELLVASIADISYLFEEGMLVDYDVDEIVKLIRALFAETPLRENTIRRIIEGHPGPGG